MLVGYMRVSTDGERQVMDLQRDALLAAGVDARHLFEDHASGGSVSARASKYDPSCAGIVPSCGRQDADRRERTGQDVQLAVIGGNMLVTV